jgi:hypothetical protein
LHALYELSLATILPLLDCCYRRDVAAAARYKDQVVAGAAALMADLLHTLWRLHSDSWTPDERATLATCRLDTLEPAAYDVEFNYGCRPIREAITLDQVGHALPLQLRLPEGIRPVAGLCLIPHALPIAGTAYRSAVEFDLPPGAFARFTAVCGLLAGHAPQSRCRFIVAVDGEIRYRSSEMGEASPAAALDLPIAGGRRLALIVETDGSTDKLALPIWGEPTVRADASLIRGHNTIFMFARLFVEVNANKYMVLCPRIRRYFTCAALRVTI